MLVCEDLVDRVDRAHGLITGIPVVSLGAREVRTRYADYSEAPWEALTPAERIRWREALAAIHSRRVTIESQPPEVRDAILRRAEEVANQTGSRDPFDLPRWLDQAMRDVLPTLD